MQEHVRSSRANRSTQAVQFEFDVSGSEGEFDLLPEGIVFN